MFGSASAQAGAIATDIAPAVSARPLRRDAELNRARILEAARELFVERGVDVGVEEIARRAGVGMGTLYRRFSNKDALVEAILLAAADGIRDLAVEVAAAEPPERALRVYLSRVLLADPCHRLFLTPRMWQGAAGRALVAEVLPLVAEMLRSAQRAGSVRADVVVADLLVLMWSLRTVTEFTETVAPGSWWRSLEIALAGFRPDDRNGELPAPSAAFAALAEDTAAREGPAPIG
ncbi:TetR family transcriptional regulator [Frankia canadensis]|uniref:TetR family transcriptional regulator n=1 Tax=Frankia canadensis TaxID=1836972 RepID=A0A2I2L0N1_9ACTN|nr:TetR/AcrR family transcriptional regulator [Frankia canadensis]SNQ51476.1 TetR family transcriptional regulator [Frankia canadensis]SOU58766.1 TetR family transcriptional regulator [Frankia canadensis]